MRIYVPDYSVAKFFSKMQKFDNNLTKTHKYNFIYSEDGMFRVDAKSIKQLVVTDGSVLHLKKSTNAYKMDLLVDTSTVEEIDIERLPFNHIAFPVQVFWHYKLKIVVEGAYKDGVFTPNDFYIDVPSDYDFKTQTNIDEINVFLSMLN
jgi:hypothetical protein